MKPLGYYTDHTPGDGGLLDTLEARFGSHFEKMSQREKFFLINSLAIGLCVRSPGEVSDEIMSVSEMIRETGITAQIGMIKFLIDNHRTDSGSNEITPPTDPAWDYHETWESLYNIKRIVDSALSVISGEEVSNSRTDEQLSQILQPVLEQLEGMIDAILQ